MKRLHNLQQIMGTLVDSHWTKYNASEIFVVSDLIHTHEMGPDTVDRESLQ